MLESGSSEREERMEEIIWSSWCIPLIVESGRSMALGKASCPDKLPKERQVAQQVEPRSGSKANSTDAVMAGEETLGQVTVSEHGESRCYMPTSVASRCGGTGDGSDYVWGEEELTPDRGGWLGVGDGDIGRERCATAAVDKGSIGASCDDAYGPQASYIWMIAMLRRTRRCMGSLILLLRYTR